MDQRQQRSVMIGGKWVKASFYVGEVLPEKHGHVRVEASAIRHRRTGMGALPSGSTVPSSRRLRKPAHRETVPDIPGDAWQLACAIGDARGYAGKRIAHASFPAATRPRACHSGRPRANCQPTSTAAFEHTFANAWAASPVGTLGAQVNQTSN